MQFYEQLSFFASKFILVTGRFKDNTFIKEGDVKKNLQDCSEFIKNEIRHVSFSNPPRELCVPNIILQKQKGAHNIRRHFGYLLACALLHCGADKLADQCQELFGVPRVKLLQQGEQSQDEWRPVHGVSRLPADHS